MRATNVLNYGFASRYNKVLPVPAIQVLEYLPALSLLTLTQVSHSFYELLSCHDQSALLWRRLCRGVLGDSCLTLHETSFKLAGASDTPVACCSRYKKLLLNALLLRNVHWWDQGTELLRSNVTKADDADVAANERAPYTASGTQHVHPAVEDPAPPLWAAAQQQAGLPGLRDCLQTRCQRSGHSVSLCGPLALVTGGILRMALPYMDVLCVHLDTLTITRPKVVGDMPRARFRHSCCIVDKSKLQGSKLLQKVTEQLGTDAVVDGHLLLVFGGYNAHGEEFGGHDLEVLWASAKGDVVRWCHVATWGPVPAHVYHHTADLVAHGTKMLVCGGESSWFHNRQSRSPIVYVLDLHTLIWAQQETSMVVPGFDTVDLFQGQRSLHMSTVYEDPDTGKEQLVVVGGYFGNQLADMWPHALDLETWAWSRGPRRWPRAQTTGPQGALWHAQGASCVTLASAPPSAGVEQDKHASQAPAQLSGLASSAERRHAGGSSGRAGEARTDAVLRSHGRLNPLYAEVVMANAPFATDGDDMTGTPVDASSCVVPSCAPPAPRQRAAGMRVGDWLLVHGGATANGVSLSGLHRLHLPSLTWQQCPMAYSGSVVPQARIAGHCLAAGLAFGGCMATIMGVLPIAKLDLMLLVNPREAAEATPALGPSHDVPTGNRPNTGMTGHGHHAAAGSGAQTPPPGGAGGVSSSEVSCSGSENAVAQKSSRANAGKLKSAVAEWTGGPAHELRSSMPAAPAEYERILVPIGGGMRLEMWRNTTTGQLCNLLPPSSRSNGAAADPADVVLPAPRAIVRNGSGSFGQGEFGTSTPLLELPQGDCEGCSSRDGVVQAELGRGDAGVEPQGGASEAFVAWLLRGRRDACVLQ